MKTILMTGAAGGIGTYLRPELKDKYALRLSDRDSIDDLGDDETFMQAELTDLDAPCAAMEGVDGILHFGGHASEGEWEAILDANIIGMRNIYEAARLSSVKRVIWASSNHAVGFYRRDQTIDHTVYPKPDSRYGVSKVFGEAMGSLYVDKYGLEVVNLRIGNVGVKPIDKRRLAIWISPRDLAQLCSIGLDHPDIRFEIFYGASDNAAAGGTIPTPKGSATVRRTAAKIMRKRSWPSNRRPRPTIRTRSIRAVRSCRPKQAAAHPGRRPLRRKAL